MSELFALTADEPLPTDDPERPLTQARAFYGVAEPPYSEELWPLRTDGLVAAADGDGTTLLGSADLYNERADDGDASNLQQDNTAIN